MSTDHDTTDPIRIAFVCVRNAGRSQMAAAFARLERDRRGLDGRVEILSGGTHPADSVHEEVIEAMAEEGFDLSDRTPREIAAEELGACDHVATMGCSTLDLDPDVDVRDWALEDPHGTDLERVREIREEVRGNVAALFDELAEELEEGGEERDEGRKEREGDRP